MNAHRSMLLLVLLGSWGPSSSSSSAAEDWIPQGAEWRYLKGTSAPPAGWTAAAFNDSSWSAGLAGIGYGDGDDATILADMQGSYLSVYTRRAFTLSDVASVQTLVLNVLYDDGFIAYLNGTEVLRRFLGATGSLVAFDTRASQAHEADGFEAFDLTAWIPLFVPGTNVLSIEAHNQDITSSDLSLHPHLVANGPAPSGPLPSGFALETIASGLRSPVAVDYTPDGRMLVAEKRGTILIVKNGAPLAEPFLDLEQEVNNAGDRGLLGFDLDPNFAANGHIYVLYVVDPVPGSPDDASESITIGRLARYTAVGDAVDPASRKLLLGSSAADGWMHCHSSHAIGTVKCAVDGTLFVGSGDGAHFDFTDGGQDVTGFDPGCAATFGAARDIGSLRSQNLDILAGKILRIDAETGLGLPDNPFYTGNPADIRSRIWVLGLRNPFRFTLRPDSGPQETIYVGDVGWNTWEELNTARGGENFGWPCYEGSSAQGSYQSDSRTGPFCQGLSSASVRQPLIAWRHGATGTQSFLGNCAAGAVFYEGSSYPDRYRGACFFEDYAHSWMRVAFVDQQDRLMSVEAFATDLQSPVDLETEPVTGNLVYVSITAGEVRRIRYTVGNRPPTIVASAAPTSGHAPLAVQFSSAGTADPDLDPVAIEWSFGDGSPLSSEPNPAHTYTAAGSFTSTVTARDSRGEAASQSFAIETQNEAPQVSIDSPKDGATFFGGEVFHLHAVASDTEDGDALSYAWIVTLLHDEHVHPEWFTSSEREPLFEAASHGDSEESFSYEIRVTVIDAGGLTATAAVALRPGQIVRGDCNADGAIDVSDALHGLLHLFGGHDAQCALALDADANGQLEITDPIYILHYLFAEGPAPSSPHPACGVAKNLEAIPCAQGCP